MLENYPANRTKGLAIWPTSVMSRGQCARSAAVAPALDQFQRARGTALMLVIGRAVGQHPVGSALQVVGQARQRGRLIVVDERLEDRRVLDVARRLPVRLGDLVDPDVADRPVGEGRELAPPQRRVRPPAVMRRWKPCVGVEPEGEVAESGRPCAWRSCSPLASRCCAAVNSSNVIDRASVSSRIRHA